MAYQAPYQLPGLSGTLPTGEFLLPVCTTRERVLKLLTALTAYRNLSEDDDLDFEIDVLRALHWVEDPTQAECVNFQEDQCYEYENSASFIEYAPNDPYNTPDLVPEGYILPPWWVVTGINLIGAEVGDVVTDLARLPILPSLPPYDRFPRFRIRFTGERRIQIYFVNVIAGGLGLIQVDGDILSIETIDLDKDLTSVPPENVSLLIWEKHITGEGDHFVDVTMIPIIDDSATVIRFGGGLRKIVLCGKRSLKPCEDCDDCPQPEPCPESDEECQEIIEEIGFEEIEDLEDFMNCAAPFIGQIVAGIAAPTSIGWLKCNGQSVLKSTYPELYAVLSGLTAETAETFALPDFRDRAPMGAGGLIVPDILATAGATDHALTLGQMPAHAHAVDDHTHAIASHNHTIPAHDHQVPDHVHGLVAHSHQVTIPAHTHGIPGRQNSAAGAGSRFMISGGTGTQDDSIQTVSGGGTTVSSGNGGGGNTNPNTVSPLMTDQEPTTATTETGVLETGAGGAGATSLEGLGTPFSTLSPVIGIDFYVFAGCKEEC